MARLSDRKWMRRELSKIAAAVAETMAPFCEVVLSDLSNPDHVIVQIENNLSGSKVGDPASPVGLARLADPNFPDSIVNWGVTISDGRLFKTTSIGIKDKSGKYLGALVLNVDITQLRSIAAYLNELTRVTEMPDRITKLYDAKSPEDVSAKIMSFAAKRNRDPRALTTNEKRELLRHLAKDGELERRGAAERIASMIGVTRSNVYYYLKNVKNEKA